MTKVSEIITIVLVAALLVSIAAALSFSGVKNSKYDYIKVEINPEIEFVTDEHGKIVTAYAINDEARELMINEKFIGLKAEKAVEKFIDLCVKANYLDVNRDDNAVKLTIVSGLWHDLNVNVYSATKKYFLNNEIKSLIIENPKDVEYYKLAKSENVCASKLALMESVCNLDSSFDYSKAKKLTEKQMLKKIKKSHDDISQTQEQYSQRQLDDKLKLINSNHAKIVYHKEKITDKTVSEFKQEYEKFSKYNLKDYEKNFGEHKKNWHDSRKNYAVA